MSTVRLQKQCKYGSLMTTPLARPPRHPWHSCQDWDSRAGHRTPPGRTDSRPGVRGLRGTPVPEHPAGSPQAPAGMEVRATSLCASGLLPSSRQHMAVAAARLVVQSTAA